jgi:hypothetical protein
MVTRALTFTIMLIMSTQLYAEMPLLDDTTSSNVELIYSLEILSQGYHDDPIHCDQVNFEELTLQEQNEVLAYCEYVQINPDDRRELSDSIVEFN